MMLHERVESLCAILDYATYCLHCDDRVIVKCEIYRYHLLLQSAAATTA